MSGMQVRNLNEHDLDEVARVHIASFYDRALSQFGCEAVKRYYALLMRSYEVSYPFCVANSEGEICGFCFLGRYDSALKKFLDQNKRYLLTYFVMHPWILFKPVIREQAKLAMNLFLNRFRVRKTPNFPNAQKNSFVHNKRMLSILSIAVDPKFQRKGIGELLMSHAEAVAKERHYEVLRLTVHPENLPAVSFYEKMGWEKVVAGGQWEGQMMKDLSI